MDASIKQKRRKSVDDYYGSISLDWDQFAQFGVIWVICILIEKTKGQEEKIWKANEPVTIPIRYPSLLR